VSSAGSERQVSGRLSRCYRQAFDYWMRLVPGRPRCVILCSFDELWVYDFETQKETPVDRLPLGERPQRHECFSASKDLLQQLPDLNHAVAERLDREQPVTPRGFPPIIPRRRNCSPPASSPRARPLDAICPRL
jgi:hypothetical protein